MPEPKRGADKFGVEHEIKPDQAQIPLTAKEVRTKASHYADESIESFHQADKK